MNRMKQRLLTFMISAALVIGIFPAIPAIADTDDNTSSKKAFMFFIPMMFTAKSAATLPLRPTVHNCLKTEKTL